MGVVVLPKNLIAKTEAHAADVMSDFNAILAQVNGKLDLENFAESLHNALVPSGTLLATARSSAPTGYLLCQGQAISRTTYAVLFAAIGTTFGNGDGATTFNLPDLRGRVPVGADAGIGRLDGAWAPRNLGQAGGNMWLQTHRHVLQGEGAGTSIENAQHTHGVTGFSSTRHEGSGFAYTNWDGTNVGNVTGAETANHGHILTGYSQNEGAGSGQNMPPYTVVNWMVKT